MRKLALAAFVVGCYHEPAPRKPAPPPPAPVALEQPRHVRTAQDPLGFLAIDSEIVMQLDLAQVRRSTLWTRFEPLVMAKAASTLDQIKLACGFDPLQMIRRVVVGMKHVDAPHPDTVIVLRGLERDRTMRCFVQTLGRDPTIATMDQGIVVIPRKNGDTPLALAFADASTLLLVGGPDVTADTMRAVLEAGTPLRGSPGFLDMFDQLDHERAAWFLINGNAKALQQMAALGVSPRGVFGSVDLTSGIAADLRLRTDDATKAQQFAAMVQGQLGAAKPFFDKIEVGVRDADIVFDLAMTDDQADKIITQMLGP
jgi:hypothetical protein